MIKRYLFILVWAVIAVTVLLMSTVYRDGREAMVAEVESRVTAISLSKTVKVDSIYVLPGQTVVKGQKLIKVSKPDMVIDLRRAKNEWKLEQLDSLRSAQKFDNELQLNQMKYQKDLQELVAEQQSLLLEIEEDKANHQLVEKIKGSPSSTSSILQRKLQYLEKEISRTQQAQQSEKRQITELYEKILSLHSINIQEQLIKIEELEAEYAELTRYAPYDGTVGAIFVELQEVAQPHQKLMSIYEAQPSLIKAYTKENKTLEIKVNQPVIVMSTNRSYEVAGIIEALGSRVTDYPQKINPNPNGNSYGQEIFIRIDPDNQFLKGEKVYVYAITE